MAGALYAYLFLDDFVLLYPVYTLLFADAGLSVWQISSLLVIWSVSSAAFEVHAVQRATQNHSRQQDRPATPNRTADCVRVSRPLLRCDSEEAPFAGHALELVRAAVLELEP